MYTKALKQITILFGAVSDTKLETLKKATDLFFRILTYIRVKRKSVGTWFNLPVVDWMKRNTNVSLGSIVGKRWVYILNKK